MVLKLILPSSTADTFFTPLSILTNYISLTFGFIWDIALNICFATYAGVTYLCKGALNTSYYLIIFPFIYLWNVILPAIFSGLCTILSILFRGVQLPFEIVWNIFTYIFSLLYDIPLTSSIKFLANGSTTTFGFIWDIVLYICFKIQISVTYLCNGLLNTGYYLLIFPFKYLWNVILPGIFTWVDSISSILFKGIQVPFEIVCKIFTYIFSLFYGISPMNGLKFLANSITVALGFIFDIVLYICFTIKLSVTYLCNSLLSMGYYLLIFPFIYLWNVILPAIFSGLGSILSIIFSGVQLCYETVWSICAYIYSILYVMLLPYLFGVQLKPLVWHTQLDMQFFLLNTSFIWSFIIINIGAAVQVIMFPFVKLWNALIYIFSSFSKWYI